MIMMRVYHHQFLNRVCVCSTKERIERKNWRQETGWPKKGHESLEHRLLEIKMQVTDYLRYNSKTITRKSLREFVASNAPKEVVVEQTLLEEWSDILKRVKGNVSPKTYSSYNNSYGTMKEFLCRLKKTDIVAVDFDTKFYQEYRSFLNEKYSSRNSVAKRLRHFKMIVNKGLPVPLDHKEITYKETAGLKIRLTEEELRDLINLKLETDRLRRIRDLFVIQCHTGVRVSDLFRLDKNIRGNFFELEQMKTGKPLRIPILPVVRYILERYDYNLPKLSHQKYNDGIKDVYKILNEKATIQVRDQEGFKDVPVSKLISSHDAVRSFITISAERGVPVPSIAKITGKTVAVLLRNYLVDSQKVAETAILEKWSDQSPILFKL